MEMNWFKNTLTGFAVFDGRWVVLIHRKNNWQMRPMSWKWEIPQRQDSSTYRHNGSKLVATKSGYLHRPADVDLLHSKLFNYDWIWIFYDWANIFGHEHLARLWNTANPHSSVKQNEKREIADGSSETDEKTTTDTLHRSSNKPAPMIVIPKSHKCKRTSSGVVQRKIQERPQLRTYTHSNIARRKMFSGCNVIR